MVLVRDFPGSSKTSSLTCKVSKVDKLLLAYRIMVRPYRVSERLEVVVPSLKNYLTLCGIYSTASVWR